MEPKKILVVDDEQKIPAMFQRKFRKKQSFKFLFAGNGKEALNLLEQHPDTRLILSDLEMPIMDGMTLLKQLRWFDGHIIIISAYADYDRQRIAKEAGAFDVLSKPIIWDDLEHTIKHALEMQGQIKRLETQNRQLGEENRQLQEQVTVLTQQLATGNTLSNTSGT